MDFDSQYCHFTCTAQLVITIKIYQPYIYIEYIPAIHAQYCQCRFKYLIFSVIWVSSNICYVQNRLPCVICFPSCKNHNPFIVSKLSVNLSSFQYYLKENRYIQVFHVCTHELWTRQMNFVKLQQNSFFHSISSSFLILLHLLSSFILKLRGVGCQSSTKTKSKPSNEFKSKEHVRWNFIKWKERCCSFLMVYNCNTAWCLKINYEKGDE